MPISINALLETVNLKPLRLKTIKWQQGFHCPSIGLYFISTSKDSNYNETHYEAAPIDDSILNFWIRKVPSIQIDNQPATVEKLKQRLCAFWLFDENIIYVGQTSCNKGLSGRLNQYYRTELGERKPHAGGHWIKTLKVLKELYVHYIPSQHPEFLEKELLRNFASQVSNQSKEKLFDPTLPLPFANLELERGWRKIHGISKSKLVI